MDGQIDRLTDFLIKYHKYEDKEIVKEYVAQHLKYGTIDWATDENDEIVAVVRWNMSEDGTVAYILELSIREDLRGRKIGSDFIVKALVRFPQLEWLEFGRWMKEHKNKRRKLNINKFLKKRIL